MTSLDMFKTKAYHLDNSLGNLLRGLEPVPLEAGTSIIKRLELGGWNQYYQETRPLSVRSLVPV